MRTPRTLDVDILRRTLSYDPETGIFTRLVYSAPNARAGWRADVWSIGDYRRICIDYVSYSAHRMAWLYMTGENPAEMVDHINGVRDDNRFCNLRLCTKYENAQNATRKITNKSGYKGVSWHACSKRWRARITVREVMHELGAFETAELAHDAYKAAAIRLHGKFAKFG